MVYFKEVYMEWDIPSNFFLRLKKFWGSQQN